MTTPSDLPPESNAGAPGAVDAVGPTDLGIIIIQDAVAAKIAARAAAEIADAGAAAPRVLGRSLPGTKMLGVRETSLTDLPKTTARLQDGVVFIGVTLSVRWPASIPAVTSAVRQHVRERVGDLTGLPVAEVTIKVSGLVTQLAAPPRVR